MKEKYFKILGAASHPFLLILRLYWGWEFFLAGTGKLADVGQTAKFFTDLGIPFPIFNAYFVGGVESLCGLLLLVGLFARFITIPLIGVLIVAYLTAHHEALFNIFKDTETFLDQEPFLFLYASLVVLFFGPGFFSLDRLFAKKKRGALLATAAAMLFTSGTVLVQKRAFKEFNCEVKEEKSNCGGPNGCSGMEEKKKIKVKDKGECDTKKGRWIEEGEVKSS